MKNINYCICLLLLFLFSPSSWSVCTQPDGSPLTTEVYNFNNVPNLWMGKDYLSDFVGGQGTHLQVFGRLSTHAKCDHPWRLEFVPTRFTSTYNGIRTDKGVVIAPHLIFGGGWAEVGVVDPNQWTRAGMPILLASVSLGFRKFEPTARGSGIIAAGPIATLKLIEQGGQTYDLVSVGLGNEITVHAGACIPPTTGNMSVDMGEWPSQYFTGVGKKTLPAQTFSLVIDCDPGLSVWGQIDGLDSVPAKEGVFGFSDSGNGAATGLGFRLENLDSKTVLKNGENGQWLNSTGDIPLVQIMTFKAQYEQISPVVTPGSANGSVTYTFSYN